MDLRQFKLILGLLRSHIMCVRYVPYRYPNTIQYTQYNIYFSYDCEEHAYQ